jgi:60 kDa SS-A/Ro ribonucleoprotein
MKFGATDCALPMLYALHRKLPIDVFEILTDSETWCGQIHPMQALKQYRQEMGINAKLVVVGMTATQFTIADPADPLCLDVVGFSTETPRLISDFALGKI